MTEKQKPRRVSAEDILDLREQLWDLKVRSKENSQVVVHDTLTNIIDALVAPAKSAALEEVEARRMERRSRFLGKEPTNG